MKNYDVIVVGGGFSGVCAALAARREGLSVLLAERGNCLGGAAAHALVNPFMFYKTENPDGSPCFLSRGLFEDLTKELSGRDYVAEGECVHGFDEEKLKLILNRRCLAAGVELLFHAELIRVPTDAEGNVEKLVFATIAGEAELCAERYIDATGDGNLCALAGCEFMLGREKDHLCQPMTLCFRVGGVEKKTLFSNRPKMQEKWKALLAEGKLRNPRENVLLFDTVHPGVVHLNTTRVVKCDPTDPFAVTRAEIEAREQVDEFMTFFRTLPGAENAFLLSTAATIGIRESRMIVGEHVLTSEELKSLVRFPDTVAVANYDIDIHNPEGTGTYIYSFPAGAYYDIPYRCLIPKGRKNLLVTGRCVSADHEAQAAVRIMPIVANLGEAAGIAAALSVRNACSVAEIDTDALRSLLLRYGAFLGHSAGKDPD